jgi:hypothetical protein
LSKKKREINNNKKKIIGRPGIKFAKESTWMILV